MNYQKIVPGVILLSTVNKTVKKAYLNQAIFIDRNSISLIESITALELTLNFSFGC